MKRLCLAVVICFVSIRIVAQSPSYLERGLKPFGVYNGGEIDTVSMENGNVTVRIPLLSYPQRGGRLKLSFSGLYNNNSWYIWTTVIAGQQRKFWEWRTGGGVMVVWDQKVDGYTEDTDSCPHSPDLSPCTVFMTKLISADGAAHQLGEIYGESPTRSVSVDLTGFVLAATFGTRDRAGNTGAGAQDANGNYISLNPSNIVDTVGRSFAYSIMDATYGKNINAATGSGPDEPTLFVYGTATTNFTSCPTSPVTKAARTWAVPVPGGTATYKFCWADYPVSTLFQVTGVTEFSGTLRLMNAIILPNGTKWLFSYNSYGDLSKVTFPTGGTIDYAYINSTFGVGVDNRTRAVSTRTVNAQDGTGDKTWNYTYLQVTGGGVLVTDPAQNDVFYTSPPGTVACGGPTRVQYFQGSKNLNNWLKTINYEYACDAQPFPYGHFGDAANVINRRLMKTTTIWPGGKASQVQNTYDTSGELIAGTSTYRAPAFYGNIVQTKEFDYGQNTPGVIDPTQIVVGPLLRQTDNSFLWQTDSLTKTNNLLDLVSATVVRDGAGNRVAETDYSYDATAPAIPSPAITMQHNATPLATKRGNLTSVSRWLNTGLPVVTTNTYFDTGAVETSTDAGDLLGNRHMTRFDYSNTFYGAYPTQVTMPTTGGVPHITNTDYDFNSGLPTSTTDENGQVTVFSYDNNFRITQTTLPDGGQVNWAYTNAVPFKVTATSKITATLSKVVEGEVDGVGRLKQTRLFEDAGAVVKVDTAYDNAGRVASVTNPYRSGDTLYYTATLYDGLGRVTRSTAPDTSATTTTYTDNCTTLTDPAGKARKSCSDGLGQLTQVFEDPSGANYETDYQYDALGNLTRVDQKGGSALSGDWRTRTFTYDSLSRLLTAMNPESGTIAYSYDSDSNVIRKDSPRPNQLSGGVRQYIDYCYDELHRLTKKYYRTSGTLNCAAASPPVTYAYDATNGFSPAYPKSHRSGMTDASGSTLWNYDKMGHVVEEQRTINVNGSSPVTKSITYGYNLDGSLATLVYPSGRTVTYTYNSAGQALSAVDATNALNFATVGTYAPHGALASVKFGVTGTFAGITASTTFNSRLQPSMIQAQAPSQTVLSLSYAYGAAGTNNGNVFQIQNNRDTTRSQNFTYDALNRIATAYSSGALWGEHFDIDPWGNLYKIRACQSGDACNGKPQGENLDKSADTANRLVGGYTYDAAGNLTNDGGPYTSTYDAENRISAYATAAYTYDGDGRRVKKSTGTLYWTGTGSDALTESNLAGTIQREFVFFNGKRIARLDGVGASPTVHYYFSDHLGSANVVTSPQGVAIQEESDYYPFGGERVVTDTMPIQNYKFTGKERDTESGMDYFGARYYASAFARWTSPDWAATATSVPYADFGNPQSLNLYGFVGNNPIGAADHDGHCCAPSELADYLDSKIQTFRQEGLAANASASPGVAALNTFSNGVTGDLAQGFTNLLRTGQSVGSLPSGASGTQIVGALAEEGGRVGGTMLLVIGVSAKASPAVNAEEVSTKAGTNSAETTAGRVDLRGTAHFDKVAGKDVDTPHVHENASNTNPSTQETYHYQKAVPRPATAADINDAASALKVKITQKPVLIAPKSPKER